MTIQQVIAILQTEKQNQVPARFHCRAIMVRDIAQYVELLEALKKINDIKMLTAEELFSGADVMPNYESLTDKKYQDKWIILPGVSEYLRLFHTNEESAQRFGTLWHYQFDASTKGRILIPLWGCETLWYDSALHLHNDIRQKDHVYNCSGSEYEPQKLNVQVLSGDFEQYVYLLETNHGSIFIGLEEWYDFWCHPKPDMIDHLILTRRYKSVKPTNGDINIHVIQDTLSFIQENLSNGNLLNVNNCPKEAQECLFTYALKGKTIDEAILSALNTYVFHPFDVMGKWGTLSSGQRQLVLLWYELHPDSSYLCHCVKKVSNTDELPKCILNSIFPARASHPEWVSESQTLIASVPIQRNDEYYEKLDTIPIREERLEYLTSNSVQERKYILHLAGEWLRDDQIGALNNDKLKAIYPELSAYLKDDYPDDELKTYFGRYKAFKLSNTLPQDQELYFMGIDTDTYDNRYPILCENINEDTVVLWIDALGIEWMPLLKWAIKINCDGDLKSAVVTQAQLPTETCFNEQWKKMDLPYEKYDKLDKLAHKGVIDDKDYYACVEEQFRFIVEIVDKVNKLLKTYSRVIITGDHGTSRLAARFFHKVKGIPSPLHSEVGSHGRYCKVDNQSQPMNTHKVVNDNIGNKYFVFSNYDHFTKPGFAAGADDDMPIYGEIHGGATPEEMLVPVLTVDSRYESPLTAKWSVPGNTVKISNKRARCRIQFSKMVSSVQAKMDGIDAECSSITIPSKEWTITFSGLKLNKEKEFNVSVLADGILVNIDSIKIKPALGGSDPF